MNGRQRNLRVAPFWKRLVTARRNSSQKAVRLSRIVSTSRFSEGWMRLLAGIPGPSGALQMRVLVLTAIGLMSAIPHFAAGEARSEAIGNWAFYAGDAGGSRYSPLDQINKTNVVELKPAWELHTGDVSDGSDGRPKSEFEATPIVVAGTMFLSTPFNRVLAVDPETGKEKWSFDPKIDLREHYSE